MLWSFAFVVLLATTGALNLPGVPTAFTENDDILSAISNEIANKFAEEYVAYKKTGVESSSLRQMSEQLAASHSQKEIFMNDVAELGAADQFFLCTTCRATMKVFTDMFRQPDGELNGPNAEANSKMVLLDFCARFNIQTPEVCDGLFNQNWPFVNYIMQNSVADTRTLCGALPIRFCQVKQQEFNWSLTVDKNGPALDAPKGGIPTKSDDDVQILHLTDIHYDADYKPHSLAACPEPMCCNRDATSEVSDSEKAGYWGDYRDCDMPMHTIAHALDHIKGQHPKIEYIYQTGDIVPHTIWSTTKEGNLEMIAKVNNLLVETFPDIKIYSCVGNHEAHPTNVFAGSDAPVDFGMGWLYEQLYDSWSKWLPADTKETILKGGYYTVSPKKGFRIISLNNNDCYLFNWWVLHDGRVGIDQLEWLHTTLLAAEKAGEHVHILAHIPSGSVDCFSVWAREYNRIIERFSHIISGIFNGHTHKDEMIVHYSKDGFAFAISWNGGSLTSYSDKNPNYRVYHAAPVTMEVVDHETWFMRLDEANEHGSEKIPQWHKEYSFAEDFTENLSPAGIDALLEKMAKHPELLRKYWHYKVTSAEPRLQKGCDNSCLMRTICHLAVSVHDQKDRCRALQDMLSESLENETTAAPVTTNKPEVTTENNDDGAVSIAAMKLTTIIGVLGLIKLFL